MTTRRQFAVQFTGLAALGRGIFPAAHAQQQRAKAEQWRVHVKNIGFTADT